MSDDFNMSMRKFLKQLGVTSQQAIEAAVRKAAEDGRLPAGDLAVEATVRIAGVDLAHTVSGSIKTDGAGSD